MCGCNYWFFMELGDSGNESPTPSRVLGWREIVCEKIYSVISVNITRSQLKHFDFHTFEVMSCITNGESD